MSPSLDVFRIESSGAAVWLCTAATVQEANQRINQLAAHNPAHYLILDLITGRRIDIVRTTATRATSVLHGEQPQL